MENKKNILIVGAGISGLSAAYELSEDSSLNITIVESTNASGGKMKGFFNTDTQRFEEHSIRALSSTYFSLFDIFHRAGILDMLSPVSDYIFYQSSSGKSVAVDRKDDLSLSTVKEMIDTFGLKKKDMFQLIQRVVKHVNLTDAERKDLSKQKAGDIIGINDFDEGTRQFIENWFGILTGARMHSKAIDIMDSFVLMFLPMSAAPNLPQNKFSKSYCFNEPTSNVINAFVEKLKSRGVQFHYNTRVLNVHKNEKITIETNNRDWPDQQFDAAIMAVPQEVLWSLGLLPEVKKPFNDEWSFGTQFPMEDIPEKMVDFAGKSYNLCFDAPWNIVFQIQHNGSFWKDVDFPKGYKYNLSATCSSPFNKGKLFGKRFMECTPKEAQEEILFQLGIVNKEERQKLIKHAVIDPVMLKYTDDWQQYSEIETVEFGILHEDNKRWINFSQIYVRNAQDKNIQTSTKWQNIFLTGEIIEVKGRWKIPTMEQAATSGKQAAQATFDFLKMNRNVYLKTSTLEESTTYKYINPLLNGLEKLINLI